MSIVYIKMAAVTNHMSKVKGFVNINGDPLGFVGTIKAKPDPAYGRVKSTYCHRSATMVTSPMTAS